MTVRDRPLRVRPRLAFWVAAGLSLLVSHDAVFLLQSGPAEGIVRIVRGPGHAWWSVASLLLLAIGAVAGAAAVGHLARLRRQARSIGAAAYGVRPRGLRFSFVLLLAAVLAAFLIQENVEHYLAHGHVIGLGALVGPEYPLAVPVIAAVSTLAALVASLVAGTEEALERAIASALARRRSPRRISGIHPERAQGRRGQVMAGAGASRAPPILVAPC